MMEDLIKRLGELDKEDLKPAEFLDKYVDMIDSYLGQFKGGERYQQYKTLLEELRSAPKSKLAEFALNCID